jgi:type II secretory pathway pseudopilin PulG
VSLSQRPLSILHSQCRGGCPQPQSKALLDSEPAREDTRLYTAAFTVLELLVVITIIVILAGLILATTGYVEKKGARSRAESEIAAFSAAMESYKADNGIYPNNNATDTLNSTSDANPSDYLSACVYLYGELTGDRNLDGTPDSGSKSYLSLRPSSLLRGNMSNPPSSSNKVTAIRDPFGNSYGYSTMKASGGSGGYNPTYDLWSTAAGTGASDVPGWIKNW